MAGSNAGRSLRFGIFALDLEDRQLYRDGRRVRLERQPFDLLVLLVERQGTLVTRKDIKARLWPDGVIVDFAASINTSIGKVRVALGKSKAARCFVETVPREGYRFVAEVEVVCVDAPPSASALAPPTEPAAGSGDAAASARRDPISAVLIEGPHDDGQRDASSQSLVAPAPLSPVLPDDQPRDSVLPRTELGWQTYVVRVGLPGTAVAATVVATTTPAVGVAAVLYGLFFALLIAGFDHLAESPLVRGAVSLVLVSAMAYVLSAWTLFELSGEVVNFNALGPAPLYPFVTGLQFLPLFVLVLAYWTAAAAGRERRWLQSRSLFCAMGALLVGLTGMALVAYSGDFALWRAGVSPGKSLALYYGVVLLVNVSFAGLGFRGISGPSRGGGRLPLALCAGCYLVLLVPALAVGTEHNLVNRHFLDVRRSLTYRASSPDAIGEFPPVPIIGETTCPRRLV